MPAFMVEIQLKDEYWKLKDSENNELVVLDILNQSQWIFKDLPFSRIVDQSNSEPDFVNIAGYELDCKMLLPQSFWSRFAHTKEFPVSELVEYTNEMNRYFEELPESFNLNDTSQQILDDFDRIENLLCKHKKKNLVLFYPFFVLDFEDSISTLLSQSPITHWIEIISKRQHTYNDLYIIYISMDNKVVIKDLYKPNRTEYIDYDFSKFIEVKIVDIVESED
jgi:hypothetical protein